VVIWYILWLFGMLRKDKSGNPAKKRTWRAELWKLIFTVDKSKESKLSQKDERRTFFRGHEATRLPRGQKNIN
jgi:predicted metal-dependent peptidase